MEAPAAQHPNHGDANPVAEDRVSEKKTSPEEKDSKEVEEKFTVATDDEHVHVEHLPEEPVFDGTEKGEAAPTEADKPEVQSGNRSGFATFNFPKGGVVWPEKAAAVKTFVRERSILVSNAFKRLSDRVENLNLIPAMENVNILSTLSSRDSPDKFPDLEEAADSHPKMKGRITLFSQSGCQDSRAVRSFLREKGLGFVEVNVDIFPQRKLELEERSGTASVPQVYFNETFIGGIDELNAMENKKELDEKIKEVFENECPPVAPLAPVYGEDEPVADEKLDEFAEVVSKLKEKVQVKDRFFKMRMFTKCFPGSEALEVFNEDQYCEREEGLEFGRKVAAKHFFHHVLQENMFEDGNHLYRFLEHDPVVTTRCFNFTGNINIKEPLPAVEVEALLRKFALAIIDAYVSDDGKHVDYRAISKSEEFRRYLKFTEELHRIDLSSLSREEKLAFFINLYNIMTIHAIIVLGHPVGPLDRRRLFGDFQYLVGGYPYSLSAIQNGVLRGNSRPPYQLIKSFGPKDKRLPVSLPAPEPLIHFALTSASKSSPALKCYSPGSIDAELRAAVRAFFLDGGVVIDMETKTVFLSKIINWYSVDFGKNDLEILRWLVNHLEPSAAENLLQLLDGNLFKINYNTYDWSLNL